MKFLLILLIPVITASGEGKSKEFRDKTKDGKDLEKDEALSKIIKMNDEFATTLFKCLTSVSSQSKGSPAPNVFVSPQGISFVLSMLLLEGKSTTRQKMWRGLSQNNSHCKEKEIYQALSNLLKVCNESNLNFQLQIVNFIFRQKTFTLGKYFQDDAQNCYNVKIVKVDFSNPKKAEKEITEYMKNMTQIEMKELVKDLSKDIKVILINYVEVRGKWQHPFKNTKEGYFHVNKDETVKVPFMSRAGVYNTAFMHEATVVAVPYKGNASALFILPNLTDTPKEGKLEGVESNLKDIIKKWKKSNQADFVDLSIPTFSVSGSFDLKEILLKFGKVDLFSDSTDLSATTGTCNLKASKALHKAKINVDERGTEAVGTTVFEAIPMRLPISVAFDRPFIAAIYNYDTRSILFIAKVTDPTK